MNEPHEWLTVQQASSLLSIGPGTVNSWALTGKLAGSTKDARRAWLVRRSEVDRILEEREQAVERRLAKWWPMTDRNRVYAPDRSDDEGQPA